MGPLRRRRGREALGGLKAPLGRGMQQRRKELTEGILACVAQPLRFTIGGCAQRLADGMCIYGINYGSKGNPFDTRSKSSGHGPKDLMRTTTPYSVSYAMHRYNKFTPKLNSGYMRTLPANSIVSKIHYMKQLSKATILECT